MIVYHIIFPNRVQKNSQYMIGKHNYYVENVQKKCPLFSRDYDVSTLMVD